MDPPGPWPITFWCKCRCHIYDAECPNWEKAFLNNWHKDPNSNKGEFKINVNVYVYSLISHRVQQTSQFTPLVLEFSLVRSHLLWEEFSAFSAAIAIHNSPLFVPPGTHHCWVDRGGMIWKACPTPLHMADSVTRAPAVTHPSTNRARRCLTSVIWRELVTTRPCATMAGIYYTSGIPLLFSDYSIFLTMALLICQGICPYYSITEFIFQEVLQCHLIN